MPVFGIVNQKFVRGFRCGFFCVDARECKELTNIVTCSAHVESLDDIVRHSTKLGQVEKGVCKYFKYNSVTLSETVNLILNCLITTF